MNRNHKSECDKIRKFVQRFDRDVASVCIIIAGYLLRLKEKY